MQLALESYHNGSTQILEVIEAGVRAVFKGTYRVSRARSEKGANISWECTMLNIGNRLPSETALKTAPDIHPAGQSEFSVPISLLYWQP